MRGILVLAASLFAMTVSAGSDLGTKRAVSVCESQRLYFCDFETEPTDWAGSGWGWCDEATMVGPDSARSGQHCRGTVCDGDYGQSNYELISPPIQLPELANGQFISMAAWQWYRIHQSPIDLPVAASVSISVNYGPWEELLPPFIGFNPSWSNLGADLSRYAVQSIRLRFQLLIALDCVYWQVCDKGWYIDDVGIYLNSFGMSAGADQTVCEDNCSELSASVSCGVPPFSYSWSPATRLSDPSSPNPAVCPDATITYILTVSDSADPPNVGHDTVTVTVAPAPVPALADTALFVNQLLCINPHGIYDSCRWNDNPASCDTCVSFARSDTSELRLTAFRGQCVIEDTMVIAVLAERGVLDRDEFFAYPNPASTVAHIRYKLLEPSDVVIELFTLEGQLVREYTDRDAADGAGGSPGVHVVDWNLNNQSGTLAANAVYVCRLTANGHVSGETVEAKTKVAVVK